MGDIAEFLEKCAVKRGDSLLFEFNGFPDENLNQQLIQQLQNLIGEDGILVVPTCTHQEGYPKPTFNLNHSPSEMGPFSEVFRLSAGVVRSNNPTHSVAAWGRDARNLTNGHRYAHDRQTPWGESGLGVDSPWDRLVELDAWWVIVSPDWRLSPLPAYAAARFTAENTGITREIPFPEWDAEWLNENFARHVGVVEGRCDGMRVLVFRLRQALQALVQAIFYESTACIRNPGFHQWIKTKQWIDAHGYLHAGTAKTIITPPLPFPRWEGKQMTGVFRDLYARVVFLHSGEQRFAFVLCDLIGLTFDLVRTVREQVNQRVPGVQVMISCTHAHSTPDTISAGYASPDYLSFLVERISESIVEAAGRLQPVRLGWSKTPIRGIAHSRRVKMTDGKVFTTRYGVPSTWRVKPDLITGRGEIDPELTVIRIETLNGQVLAAISNFGVHPSIALASSLASGDFPGEAMHILELAYGPDAVVLCTTGAAGDVDPTSEMPIWGPRNEQNTVRIGRLFAAQVLEALEHTPVSDYHNLQTCTLPVQLKVREDWRQLFTRDQAKLQAEFSQGWELTGWIRGIVERGSFTTEVQAARLNDLTLLAMPGEIFARTSLCLKKMIGQPVMVLETTNDYIGYIPPAEAFEEGGYECGQHFASRLYPDAEEDLRIAAFDALSSFSNAQFTGNAA